MFQLSPCAYPSNYIQIRLKLINQMKIEKNECIEIDNFQGIIIFFSFISFHLNKKRE